MIHTEGLHAIEQGLVKYMLEILFKSLPPASHHQLDQLVKHLLKSPRQHGYKGLPRVLWQDGVSTLTLLTGDLRMGKLFAISCIASQLEGQQFFIKYLEGGECSWRKMLYVFQQILCYWAWLKQDNYWMVDDMEACQLATASIKIMMRQLQALWPRQDGLEWNLTKVHKQFHMPFDIHRHGAHRNVHTGPQEHNHIDIKLAAKRTQLNKRLLDAQTGERLTERLIIQRAYDHVVMHATPNVKKKTTCDPNQPSPRASKGSLRFRCIPQQGRGDAAVGEFIFNNSKYASYPPLFQDEILAFIGSRLLREYGTEIEHDNDT